MFVRTALFTILVLSFITARAALGQLVEKPSDDKVSLTTPWLPPSAFKENPDDDELTRLLKDRYRTAAEEVASVAAFVELGVGDSASLQRLSDAESRASRAALELCQTSTQRIAVLQKVLDARKRTEAYCKEKQEAGQNPAYSLLLARYERLEAEIALARAKREATEEKEKK